MQRSRTISPRWPIRGWHSWHNTWILLSLAVAGGASAFACGGSAASSDDERNTTGGPGSTMGGSSGSGGGTTTAGMGSSATGSPATGSSATGSSATGSAGGSGGSSASSSAGGTASVSSTTAMGVGGSAVCCNGLPTCPVDYVEVGVDGCPGGVECLTVELCCDSVVCMPDIGASCDAYPTCDAGDREVDECPADARCYTEALCGSTITCQEVHCNSANEPYRDYVAMGDTCDVVDFVCPEQTTAFFNDCGCGCEQDEACPEFVDCEPGGELDPLCTDTETCPLTERAQ